MSLAQRMRASSFLMLLPLLLFQPDSCVEEEEDAEADDDDYDAQSPSFVPPGAHEDNSELFGRHLQRHFYVPERLREAQQETVDTINDWHFAMMNDVPRNDAFRAAMAEVITEDSVVLDIGTGSGLLAMTAAKLGAKKVYALEGNPDLAQSASRVILANGLERRIQVINKLSTKVSKKEVEGTSICVSEILGTNLLGEGVLEYMEMAREQLLPPDVVLIPSGGVQYFTLIQAYDVQRVTHAEPWWGLDFSHFNSYKDSASLVFTKQYGFRLGSIDFQNMSRRVPLYSVDFYKDRPSDLPHSRTVLLPAEQDGCIHAVMCSWELFLNQGRNISISTHPEDTRDNFPRDMAWGQSLQLVADEEEEGVKPLCVRKGEMVEVTAFISSVTFNFRVRRHIVGTTGEGTALD